ncbi:hypothetical protein [Pseudomonas salmasensis]|uniref:hypothetical protein n=1 Tax=Pseudomonas salmasensis TaxID=2745514 RepID=UPI00164498B7|nr:hypothetical protein [Pseudomonas salmasensis]QXH81065.1 hypothetical protein HU731_014645 [Pseudomonas salmasensis]
MLAKNVNDNAWFLDERGAYEFFASKLAPTQQGFSGRFDGLFFAWRLIKRLCIYGINK